MSNKRPASSRLFLLVPALLALHCLLSVGSMRKTSLTWDEPSYIGIGRQVLETRNLGITSLQLHPPLSYYTNSLPLLFLKFDSARFAEEHYLYHKYIGPALVFDSAYPPKLVMFLARIPSVILSVLLGILVYVWSKELYGQKAALLSLFFYSLCPTILAHCTLATPDILLALTMTLALFTFHTCLTRNLFRLTIPAGVALGLSLLSKFTSLILIPTFMLLSLLPVHGMGEDDAGRGRGRNVSMFFLVAVVAAIIVWAGYGFQFGTPFVPEWLKPQAERLIAEKPFWHAADRMAERGIRIPAYSYILGMYTQLAAARGWKDNFLIGQISSSGWWYFYWVAFLIKTPLPFIACLVIAIAVKIRNRVGSSLERFLLFSVLPMLILFSLPTKINIGIRYMLPMFPLLCILAGRVAAVGARKWKWTLLVLCVWYASSAFWVYPRYIVYFNELVGGPSNGYKYLVDSNLDWGQSLDELAAYLRDNEIEDARIKYFGPPGVMEYYGMRNADLNDCAPSAGIMAVSATYLQNLYLDDRHCHDWLKNVEPKAVLGHSIFIFDVTSEAAQRYAR